MACPAVDVPDGLFHLGLNIVGLAAFTVLLQEDQVLGRKGRGLSLLDVVAGLSNAV